MKGNENTMSEILSYEKFIENLRGYLLDALNLQEKQIYFEAKDEEGMTPNGDRLFVECRVSSEGKEAYDKLEVPVGCVIVKDGKIISRAHNLKETKFDTTKHAEILAIQKASKKLKSWRLINCQMYVTLEPCSMCAGAIINSRIKKLYIGALDSKTGACGSVLNLLEDYKFNHKVEVEKNVMKQECENILKDFFKNLRKIKSKK